MAVWELALLLIGVTVFVANMGEFIYHISDGEKIWTGIRQICKNPR